MASFATLTLVDGQGTPANHSFNPFQHRTLPDGRNLFEWLDTSVNGGVLSGANRLRLWTRMPTTSLPQGKDMKLVAEGQLIVPVMDAVDVTLRLEETTMWFKLFRGGRASTQNTKDVNAFARSFLANAAFTDIVNDFKELS